MRSLKYARLGVVVVVAFLCLRTSMVVLRSLHHDAQRSDIKGQLDDQIVTSNLQQGLPGKNVDKNQPTIKVHREDDVSNFELHKNQDSKGRDHPQDHGEDLEQVWHHMNDDYRCKDPVRRPAPEQVHTRNTHWQLYDLDGTKNHLLVYSAFYDDRPDSGYLPFIRILGVVNNAHDPLYCQLWFEDIEIPQIVDATITKSGRGDRFDGISYGQHLYSCKLISAYPRPTHVSMTTKPCETSSIMLPVVWPIRSLWQQDFAICVPIAFGNFDPLDLIEWFEMAKLLGVGRVHVYNASMSVDLNKVFNFYQRSGLLKIHAMPPPVNHFDKMGSKLASPASLNDCMLRYMYTYRYIFFIDFDELIVPQTASNYTSMLKDINKNHKLAKNWQSYSFRNAYHFLDMPGDPGEKSYMKFLKYRKRATPSGFLYAAKSMIDPQHCLSVFNHYCYIRFPNSAKPFTIDVDVKLAVSHHYRQCNVGKAKCEGMFKTSKTDDAILRFRDVLKKKVEAVIPSVS